MNCVFMVCTTWTGSVRMYVCTHVYTVVFIYVYVHTYIYSMYVRTYVHATSTITVNRYTVNVYNVHTYVHMYCMYVHVGAGTYILYILHIRTYIMHMYVRTYVRSLWLLWLLWCHLAVSEATLAFDQLMMLLSSNWTSPCRTSTSPVYSGPLLVCVQWDPLLVCVQWDLY